MTDTINQSVISIPLDSHDHTPVYPLVPPLSGEKIQLYPVENIPRATLEKFAAEDKQNRSVSAILVPADAGTTIKVYVSGEAVGTLRDPELIFDSQFARIFASGSVIDCVLRITLGESYLAAIELGDPARSTFLNSPPTTKWTLLPGGKEWTVEPTKLSLFKNLPAQATVLCELREVEGIVYLYLDGQECGILDVDSAVSLADAIAFCQTHDFRPMVRTFVNRECESHVLCIRIDALPFIAWTKSQRLIETKQLPALVPFSEQPSSYRSKVVAFSSSLENQESTSPYSTLRCTRYQNFAPNLWILLGVITVFLGVHLSSFSPRGAVGFLGLGITAVMISLWVLFRRNHDSENYIAPRHWDFITPLALGVAIPSIVFANIGLFVDSDESASSFKRTELTTLSSIPFEILIASPPIPKESSSSRGSSSSESTSESDTGAGDLIMEFLEDPFAALNQRSETEDNSQLVPGENSLQLPQGAESFLADSTIGSERANQNSNNLVIEAPISQAPNPEDILPDSPITIERPDTAPVTLAKPTQSLPSPVVEEETSAATTVIRTSESTPASETTSEPEPTESLEPVDTTAEPTASSNPETTTEETAEPTP